MKIYNQQHQNKYAQLISNERYILYLKNSKATDANKRNATYNSNLNNQQHPLPTNNNNNIIIIQKRNTTKSILQYFPSINAKETISN